MESKDKPNDSGNDTTDFISQQ